MSETTANEIKENYTKRLGRNFGEYFFLLDQNVLGLVSIWDTYRIFYGTNSERVDLLNRASGFVARTIQDALHERIILGICQVTDPPKHGRNITIERLKTLVPHDQLRVQIIPALKLSSDKTSFARKLRDKLIAHSDFATQSGSNVVPDSSREQIVAAIRSIIAPLRMVHQYYFNTKQLYHAIRPLPDEFGFLECLYHGDFKQEERNKTWLSGNPDVGPRQRLPSWLERVEPREFDL